MEYKQQRKEIVEFLKKSKEELNIREISKATGINYNATYNHIRTLKELGKVIIQSKVENGVNKKMVRYIEGKK